MGEKVGKIEEFKFFKDTACVHMEEREFIAFCEIYALFNPEDKEFNEELTELYIPALTKWGHSKWYRDTLTDLAFALSSKKRRDQSEDASNLLEEIEIAEESNV